MMVVVLLSFKLYEWHSSTTTIIISSKLYGEHAKPQLLLTSQSSHGVTAGTPNSTAVQQQLYNTQHQLFKLLPS